MKDQDLVWPFSIKKIVNRWKKRVVKGKSDDPMVEADEIMLLLVEEVHRLRAKLKQCKQRHHDDAEFLCDEIERQREAIKWIKQNLVGSDDYIQRAFRAVGPKYEKIHMKRLDAIRKRKP